MKRSGSESNIIGIEDVSFNSVYEILKDFSESWKNLGYSGKKNLLWSLLSKITVDVKTIKIDLFFLPSLFSKVSRFSSRTVNRALTKVRNLQNVFVYSVSLLAS